MIQSILDDIIDGFLAETGVLDTELDEHCIYDATYLIKVKYVNPFGQKVLSKITFNAILDLSQDDLKQLLSELNAEDIYFASQVLTDLAETKIHEKLNA